MVKKKSTPAEAGKGQTIVASYYLVVEKPAENKNGSSQEVVTELGAKIPGS